MNRHLLYFTQRVASAAASSLVYALADKYAKPKKYKPKQVKYPSSQYTQKKQRTPDAAKPLERKPHHSMAEQMQSRRNGRH